MKYNKFFLSIALALFGMVSASAVEKKCDAVITAASYNIRQANHSDSVNGNGWGRRLPHLADLIRFHDFEIFGTQEGFKPQLEGLKSLLPGFEYTGVARDDGKEEGEHSAIFYRTDLFELLDHGDFWLSEHPEKPGLGWDAVCVRICSWGKFVHKPSGRVFTFFNLHMDHVGKQARIESAKLVRQRISEIAGNGSAIVTGDFNVDQTHQSYRTMTDGNELEDSYEKADFRYAPNGTFNNYSTDDFTTSRIDHIFVTPGIDVIKYGVLTDSYRTDDGDSELSRLNDAPDGIEARKYTARVPSDHFPVVTELLIPATPGFNSLADTYSDIARIEGFEPLPAKEISRMTGVKVKNVEAVISGNAHQRTAIIEQLSKIPCELVNIDETSDDYHIYRVYFEPGADPARGDALFIVLGHGPNDTVVILLKDIARKDIRQATNIK